MKYNLELTSQVTQMRTHYCREDVYHLQKKKQNEKKKEE